MSRRCEALLSAVLLCCCAALAHGNEVIERFRSDLHVAVDGSMLVVETITVLAEGKQIKRGIYRDFPTTYRDRYNNRVQVRFDVLHVRRNAIDEPWFTTAQKNGQRLWIGSKDAFIDKGRHVYEITYRTDRQLGYFAEHDELYWNVTGNGWALPIRQALASVSLPDSVPASSIAHEAYTGASGEKGADYESGIDDQGRAWFRSTRALAAGEGLTIVAGWPKGHVHEPTTREHVQWLLQDNGRLLAGVLGALFLLGYYLLQWLRIGRDPQAGIIITRYEPPQDYSPASMRFVQRMGYDPKTFTAALVNLAAKGHVRIAQDDGDFVIVRERSSEPLAPGEKVLLAKLLGTRDRLLIQRSAHQVISRAMEAHKTRLEADYERKYFSKNITATAIGIGISLLVLITTLFWPGLGGVSEGESAAALFMTVWLSGWSFGVFALLSKAIGAWRAAHGGAGYAGAIFLSMFSLPFIGGWFMGAGMLVTASSLSMVFLIACLVGLNVLFYELMKAPSLLGRDLLDQIEGFREYLTLAESDELRLRNPPARTPALFEKLLPYAIALDVEDVWGERFEQVLAAARRDEGYAGPSWYSNDPATLDSFSAGALVSSVGGALASSISASSRAPGSSSGSSGGGSSGGGGGGGGGGGW